MKERMIEKINETIKLALEEYKEWGMDSILREAKIKIVAMIEMLEIATGEQYTYDKNGVHEYYPL